MKRIYKKPNLTVESFVTEEVMSKHNALSQANNDQANFDYYQNDGYIIFNEDINAGNILNSIDYSTFSQE